MHAARQRIVLLLSALLLLLGTVFTCHAQGAPPVGPGTPWPPTPAAGDNPYTTGLFTYNGRTYKVEFLFTFGTASADQSTFTPAIITPTASNSGSSPVQFRVNDIWSSTYYVGDPTVKDQFVLDYSSVAPYLPAGYTLPSVPGSTFSASTAWNGLLRRVHTSGFFQYGSADASFSVQSNVWFAYRVTLVAGSPPSDRFGVWVGIAYGGEAAAIGSISGINGNLSSSAVGEGLSASGQCSLLNQYGTVNYSNTMMGCSQYIGDQVWLDSGSGFSGVFYVNVTGTIQGSRSGVMGVTAPPQDGQADLDLQVVPFHVYE